MDSSNNRDKNFLVISTGTLVKDADQATVIKNICSRFSMDEAVANKLLKPRVVLKKGVSAATANRYKQQFLTLGLHLDVINPDTSSQNHLNNKREIPLTVKDFETLLDGAVPKVKVSTQYKLGLLLVVLVSTIAPIIYLGIVLGIALGIYTYVNMLPEILSTVSGGTVKAAIVIIPNFIASVLLLFLLKALFVKHAAPNEYEARFEQFPALFNLVSVMCKKIGVPMPKKIILNNQVNASAGAKNGVFSLMRGELKLTVGLPLMTGMNIRQFTGVLAHEFGHFAQPTAMLAHYVVHSINYWFANRAYEPDAWDERLADWSKKADWYFIVQIAIMGAQLSIMLTRKLFAGLYLLNLKTTRFMSRHMEYDADAYESIFSGSEQFENTAVQLRKLSYANHEVQELNRNAWNESKLLDNLPSAIADIAKSYDDNIEQAIKDDMDNAKTNAWDSHPADNDRISHVLNRGDTAILIDEFSAYLLCEKMNELCQKVTLFEYQEYGMNQPEQYITKNADILDMDRAKQNASHALNKFFNKNFYGRCLNFESLINKKSAPKTLQATVDQLRKDLVSYEADSKKYQRLTEQYSLMILGMTYKKNGVFIEPEYFHLTDIEENKIEAKVRDAKGRIEELSDKLNQTDQLFFHRLQHDAQLMDAEQLKQVKFKLGVLKKIEYLSDKLFSLQHNQIVLGALLGNDEDLYEQINFSIDRYAQYCLNEANNIIEICKDMTNGQTGVDTVYSFILTWSGDVLDKEASHHPQDILAYSSQVLGAVRYHYYWVLADICDIVLTVEEANDISPIRLVPEV